MTKRPARLPHAGVPERRWANRPDIYSANAEEVCKEEKHGK